MVAVASAFLQNRCGTTRGCPGWGFPPRRIYVCGQKISILRHGIALPSLESFQAHSPQISTVSEQPINHRKPVNEPFSLQALTEPAGIVVIYFRLIPATRIPLLTSDPSGRIL